MLIFTGTRLALAKGECNENVHGERKGKKNQTIRQGHSGEKITRAILEKFQFQSRIQGHKTGSSHMNTDKRTVGESEKEGKKFRGKKKYCTSSEGSISLFCGEKGKVNRYPERGSEEEEIMRSPTRLKI